tara:strand:- start:2214 stop:3605 length:1392 start_codon:yes stop_codon:yes gene_type:complete
MNQFQLVLVMLIVSFLLSDTKLVFADEQAVARSKKVLKLRVKERKTPIKPPAKTEAQRREIPGISNQPPSSKPTLETTAEIINVDQDLQIVIPHKINDDYERQFIFEPYSQGYIMRVIKLLHVILPEIEANMMRLDYRKNTLINNMRFLINTRHFFLLLTQHKIFQLRNNALEIFLKINHKFVNKIVIDVQKNPNKRLIEIQKYLTDLDFEDIYSLKTLYESIMDHLQRDNLKEGRSAYDWINSQYKLSTNDDSLHTYRFFLNKRPVKIMDQFLKSLQILYYENLQDLLPMASKTYLNYSGYLLEDLKLLDTDRAVVRRLDLLLEFSRLQFEPYEDHSKIYENLMEVYPKIPGARSYFDEDIQRANLIFPFFDQLINYANRRYERGKHACQDPLANDRDTCLQHWREASDIYRYVARYSPHSVITRKALDQLSTIQTNKIIDYPFISKAELLELIDKSKKPHL